MLADGQLLADRYRLTRRIAVGGMGEVWEAQDTRLDRKVALKVLKAELSGDAEFVHRFRTEARTTASLNHKGVAAVHDYGETASTAGGPDDTAYLVMELVDGEPMAALLANYGRLSVDFTLDVLEQSAHALQAAHESGLVHRDVKPGNIMIASRPGGEISVKLTDFGIAKAAHAAPVTRSGMVMGTAHYIAPEQATGSEASPASDVYSLAVCGYECLAGRRPFLSDHAVTVAMQHIRDAPPPLPPDIPAQVRALIEIGMAKDPRQRYASGGEFAAAIALVRTGQMPPPPRGYQQPQTAMLPGQPMPTQAMPAGAQYPATGAGYAQPPARRGSKTWAWVLGTIALVAVAVLAAFLLFGNKGSGSGVVAPSNAPTPTPDRTTKPERTTTQQRTHETRTTTRTEEETTTPDRTTSVQVPNDQFRGFPAGAAVHELRKEGLRAMRVAKGGGSSDRGGCRVTSIIPNGEVPSGSHVIVLCAPGGDEDGEQ
ncbi:serine/threonine-protein kinase [Sciscionella marina]|uniref:serine/threonine-protein kinase n=1 Tax=Sciscionella marina TaxID=508770 RepID=UPI00036D3757|nr:serine/threonine-protein kinase [Sciscionella marina]